MKAIFRHSTTLIGFALLCGTAFASGAAVAAPATDSPDAIKVSYTGADLADPQSAKRLYRRIQFAARQVCHEPDIRELALHALYEKCYDEAVDIAVSKVDATALTALHREVSERANHRRQG